MIAAIRSTVDVPAEYTNDHLRWQIAMTVLKFPKFFLPVLKEQIRGIYAHARLNKEELASRERERASFQRKTPGIKRCQAPSSFSPACVKEQNCWLVPIVL